MNRDVLGHLFSFLDDGKDLANCGIVCRDWNEVSLIDSLWKRPYERIWNVSVESDPKKPNYRLLYRKQEMSYKKAVDKSTILKQVWRVKTPFTDEPETVKILSHSRLFECGEFITLVLSVARTVVFCVFEKSTGQQVGDMCGKKMNAQFVFYHPLKSNIHCIWDHDVYAWFDGTTRQFRNCNLSKLLKLPNDVNMTVPALVSHNEIFVIVHDNDHSSTGYVIDVNSEGGKVARSVRFDYSASSPPNVFPETYHYVFLVWSESRKLEVLDPSNLTIKYAKTLEPGWGLTYVEEISPSLIRIIVSKEDYSEQARALLIDPEANKTLSDVPVGSPKILAAGIEQSWIGLVAVMQFAFTDVLFLEQALSDKVAFRRLSPRQGANDRYTSGNLKVFRLRDDLMLDRLSLPYAIDEEFSVYKIEGTHLIKKSWDYPQKNTANSTCNIN